jgi:hypothetical protein
MSDVSGAIAGPFPSSGTNKERHGQSGSTFRFTPLLSREAWAALSKKRDKRRIYSAICFPGWEQD